MNYINTIEVLVTQDTPFAWQLIPFWFFWQSQEMFWYYQLFGTAEILENPQEMS